MEVNSTGTTPLKTCNSNVITQWLIGTSKNMDVDGIGFATRRATGVVARVTFVSIHHLLPKDKRKH